jgi:UDPglucose 6-dehydrogenase
MKICVYGLWHLGSVTAASLASLNHEVVGLDFDKETIRKLSCGKAPIFEPNLDSIILKKVNDKKLFFTSNINTALGGSKIVWVTYDTPLKNNNNADISFVLNKIKKIIPYVLNNTTILISSQLPVGSTKNLEEWTKKFFYKKKIKFAYSPENLILGKSIKSFLQPERIIMGIRENCSKIILNKLLSFAEKKIIFMSIESAEMVKHSINSFLATSVVFANEIASICEAVGADAKQVEKGLKSEIRIGPKAYLSPGTSFAGGTLERDLNFLKIIGKKNNIQLSMLRSVKKSNDHHKLWIKKKILKNFTFLKNLNIGIWGLTYKPNTNTLRNSLVVDLCFWLSKKEVNLYLHDPVVKDLPIQFNKLKKINKFKNCFEMLKKLDILIIATKYSEYEKATKKINNFCKKDLTIIDPNRILIDNIFNKNIKYIAVGSL